METELLLMVVLMDDEATEAVMDEEVTDEVVIEEAEEADLL